MPRSGDCVIGNGKASRSLTRRGVAESPSPSQSRTRLISEAAFDDLLLLL